jgi:hypothetical protein
MNKINFASLPNISPESNLQLSRINNLKYLRRNAISMPNISITENSSSLLKDVIVTTVLSNESDQPKAIMNDTNLIKCKSLPKIITSIETDELSKIKPMKCLRRNAISMPNISITENSSSLFKDVIVTTILSNESDQPKAIMNDTNLIKCKSLPKITTSIETDELLKIKPMKCLRRNVISMPNLYYTIVADGQEEPNDLTGAQELTPAPAPSAITDTTRRKRNSLWCRTNKSLVTRSPCPTSQFSYSFWPILNVSLRSHAIAHFRIHARTMIVF